MLLVYTVGFVMKASLADILMTFSNNLPRGDMQLNRDTLQKTPVGETPENLHRNL